MLEANDMVEAKLAEIREKKIYEMKRMYAAEAVKISSKQFASDPELQKVVAKAEKGKKQKEASTASAPPATAAPRVRSNEPMEKAKPFAGGVSPKTQAALKAGKRRASDVLGDPRTASKAKKASANKNDEIGSLMNKLGSQWKAAKFGERRQAVRMVRQAAKQFHAANVPSLPDMSKEKRIGSEPDKQAAKTKMAKGMSAAGTKPAMPPPKSPSYKRPGMLKRNINTLMGREPGHVDDRTPEEKLKQKGGRGGKIVRKVGTGLGRALGSITSDLADIGTRHL